MSRNNVVLDIGSYKIVAGFSGEDNPKFALRTEFLRNGDSILLEESYLESGEPLESSVRFGEVVDLNGFEKIIEKTVKELGINPEEYGFLLSSHPQRSHKNAEQLAMIMFETFNVPRTYIALKPVLNLYANGATTGFSVVMGHNVTSWMPVFEGYSVSYASGTSYLAGTTVTEKLFEILKDTDMLSSQDLNSGIVDKIKKEQCFVSQNYEADIQLQNGTDKKFQLRNGIEIPLGDAAFRASEVLFKPSLIGRDIDGLHYTFADSILSSPMDMRKDLQNNIYITGGTSNLSGLSERLSSELREIDIEAFEKCKVKINPLLWTGGSILASLGSMSKLWLSKEEYDEDGPSRIRKKCSL